MYRTIKIDKCKNVFEFCISKKAKVCKIVSREGIFEAKETMVGERSRREPSGEAENWKKKMKVWHKLEKGNITRFLENLHGFDVEITKLVVDS